MNRHFKYLRFSCWILPLLVFLACNPVIANTDNDHNNRLTTATLTSSDLENKAEYKAKSYSFSAGIGLNQQANGQLKAAPSASAGASDLSDSANSVATSGVSGGEVNLTDNAKQTELTGKDAITTVATLNRDVTINDQGEAVDSQGNPTAGTLKPIFDADKIQKELNAQTQITQAFSQVAPKAVADFAKKKFEEYIAEGNLAEAEKWADGGAYRVALHAAVGGLAGNLDGALGAGISAAVIPEIGDAIDELDIPTELKQALVMATATAVGSAVGGTTGAGAALSEATNNWLTHQEIEDGKRALATCKSNVIECKAKITEALQSLDAEREKQKTQAQYLSQNAYYMEVLGCEGDNDCISKYQSIRYQTEEHLHELYIKYVNGEISEERFSGGMEVALKLAAEGAGERVDNLKNLSWDQIKNGLVASYQNAKNIVTADVPAFEIDKAFDNYITSVQTDKGIGGMAFDNALGMVVGYAGGKLVGWSAKTGWKILTPNVAQQAEQFLQSRLKAKSGDNVPKNVTVYRVEGAPNTRIVIGKGGQVIIHGETQALYLNFGDRARAEAFLAKRVGQGMPGATVKQFEVPQSALDDLRASAVPESMVKNFPDKPIIADPTKAPDQYGLRSEHIEELRRQIIQGSGKEGL